MNPADFRDSAILAMLDHPHQAAEIGDFLSEPGEAKSLQDDSPSELPPFNSDELVAILRGTIADYYREMGEPMPKIDEAKLQDEAERLLASVPVDEEEEYPQQNARAVAPTLYAKKDAGQWITIGGKEGEDGKKHGGSPVFVHNGRITKGAPSLTGKKIGDVKGSKDESSHREQLKRSKGHALAKLLKKAKAEGIEPGHVRDLAEDIQGHHKEFTDQHNAMLKDAREALDSFGGGHRVMHAAQARGGKGQMEDSASIPGLDLVAREMAHNYPGMFGNNTGYHGDKAHDASDDDAGEKLHEYLSEGKRQHMTDEEAYEQALEHLREHKREASDDDIPFDTEGLSEEPEASEETPEPAEDRDLFGQPVYNPPTNKTGETGDIFAPGSGWQTAKDDWLAEHGVKADETRMDQTFRVGKKWYEVKRNPETNELEVGEKPVSGEQHEDGKPLSITAFRGESAYGTSEAMHGLGRYYSLDENPDPRLTGINLKEGSVKSEKLELKRPKVIHSVDEMKELKRRAEKETGKDFGSEWDLLHFLTKEQAPAFTKWMQDQDYDGLVTTYRDKEGGRQAVKFTKPATAKAEHPNFLPPPR